MAGRKPKPTALKKLEGNPGKRKLNTKEPNPWVAICNTEQLMPCRNPIEPIQIFTANQIAVFYSTNFHEKAQMDNGS